MIEPRKRNVLNLMRPADAGPASEAALLLDKLLQSGFIDSPALEALPVMSRAELAHFSHSRQLLARLVDFNLLTSYQADRIRSGNVQAMILGGYRVLDRLGAGKDGVIFRGVQRETGQDVAIKVLIPTRDLDPQSMVRFFAERKTVAQLNHPGIVRALDVGETSSADPDEPVLYYYVMEHVPGLDLEQHVHKHGPMAPDLACAVAHQVADALTEAHQHNLVHRDIKPSNIILTPAGRAMLLDFGLVRQFNSRQTVLGSLVGMLEWIAPEQVQDAHAVDIRADIYSLGCTLFWCLTAQSPHGTQSPRPVLAQVPALRPPPSVRATRSDLTPELDAVVARLMAPLPGARYPDPQAVMAALAPFVSESHAAEHIPPPDPAQATAPVLPTAPMNDRRMESNARPLEVPAPPFWQPTVNWLLGRKQQDTPS